VSRSCLVGGWWGCQYRLRLCPLQAAWQVGWALSVFVAANWRTAYVAFVMRIKRWATSRSKCHDLGLHKVLQGCSHCLLHHYWTMLFPTLDSVAPFSHKKQWGQYKCLCAFIQNDLFFLLGTMNQTFWVITRLRICTLLHKLSGTIRVKFLWRGRQMKFKFELALATTKTDYLFVYCITVLLNYRMYYTFV